MTTHGRPNRVDGSFRYLTEVEEKVTAAVVATRAVGDADAPIRSVRITMAAACQTLQKWPINSLPSLPQQEEEEEQPLREWEE